MARRTARRVALVSAANAKGGAEVVIELLAARLGALGVVPVLCAPEDGELVERWRRSGHDVCPLPVLGRLRRVDLGARAVVELARRFRAAGIDLVHSHGVAAHIYGGLAARRLGRPAIHHSHDLFDSRWSADGALQRIALRVPAARTIAISSTVAAALRGRVPAHQLVVIADGVDRHIVPAAPRDPSSPLVVWCGRLQRWKGAHLFVAACAEMARANARVRFAVIGGSLFGLEPGYAAELMQQVSDAGLDQRLVFAGHVDDARPWLRAASVLVHSSVRPEPFGLVMAEAMMQERPVVAFRHGGAAEIVIDGETGRLVSPGDAVALGRAVHDVVEDLAVATAMGQAGRKRALQYFDADVMTASVVAVYDSLRHADG